jgi:hypothetical protein
MKKIVERNVDILVILFVVLSLLISSLALADKGTDEIKNKFIIKKYNLYYHHLKYSKQ